MDEPDGSLVTLSWIYELAYREDTIVKDPDRPWVKNFHDLVSDS
jgi:hypothetical protein